MTSRNLAEILALVLLGCSCRDHERTTATPAQPADSAAKAFAVPPVASTMTPSATPPECAYLAAKFPALQTGKWTSEGGCLSKYWDVYTDMPTVEAAFPTHPPRGLENNIAYYVDDSPEGVRRLLLALSVFRRDDAAFAQSRLVDAAAELISNATGQAAPPDVRAAILAAKPGSWQVGRMSVALTREEYPKGYGLKLTLTPAS